MTSPCCSFFFFLCDDLMAPAWSQHPVVSSQQRWMETHINSHFLLTVLWELGWNWRWIWMLKLGVKHFHRSGVLHWGTTTLFNGKTLNMCFFKLSVGDLLACSLKVTQWHCGKQKKTLTQEWTWHRRSVIYISIKVHWSSFRALMCPLCFADGTLWRLMTTSGQNVMSCLVSLSFRPLVWFPARPGNETGLDNIYILPCAAVLSLVELNPQWEELTGVLCSLVRSLLKLLVTVVTWPLKLLHSLLPLRLSLPDRLRRIFSIPEELRTRWQHDSGR